MKRSAVGYLKKQFFMSAREAAGLREAIRKCAAENGLALDALFVDEVETAPHQLHVCITALLASQSEALIVPDLSHLASEGNPRELRFHLEHFGLAVLTALPK